MNLQKLLYPIYRKLFNNRVEQEIKEAEGDAFSAGVRIGNQLRESHEQNREIMMRIAVTRDLNEIRKNKGVGL